MPNYTCLETIERSKRSSKRRKYELIDVLRIEVGYVDGKELFAWPGSGKFDDRDIGDMVPSGGAIGNGNFASHSGAVFRGNVANMKFGAIEEDGLFRYDYEVPLNLSGYRIRTGKGAGTVVAYHGSFWVDPNTKRVRRITVLAENVPAFLDISETTSSIDYAEVQIGERPYWLPVSSSMGITDLRGGEFRNEITFTGCRQFGGESVLRFDDPDPSITNPEPPKPVTEVVLPKDKMFAIDLGQRLRWGQNQTGDEINATLVSDFKYKDAILLPKGSKVTGRILRFQQDRALQAMEVEFTAIEGGGRRAVFHASINQPAAPGAIAPRGAPGTRIGRNSTIVAGPKPGTFTVLAYSQMLDLPKGFRIAWITLE
ncbi:hypothetical protein F183_A34420 [Bryobacterales bacterium F-183]|nr:hypothetical protein F183_A34420 [Bryobacterales bacterium F-183]